MIMGKGLKNILTKLAEFIKNNPDICKIIFEYDK